MHRSSVYVDSNTHRAMLCVREQQDIEQCYVFVNSRISSKAMEREMLFFPIPACYYRLAGRRTYSVSLDLFLCCFSYCPARGGGGSMQRGEVSGKVTIHENEFSIFNFTLDEIIRA